VAARVSRRFGKHNIIGCEAHQARPLAYVHKGFVARRPRSRPRALFAFSLLGLALALMWFLR
jgi:hypothetical protein